MSFSNKVAIVTGAGSGIGAATAIMFAKNGANVVLVDRNKDSLKNIAGQCNPAKDLVIEADITEGGAAADVINTTITKYGNLDILINNAGISVCEKIMDEGYVDTYSTMMDTNLKAPVVMTSLAAPHLAKTRGNIINICSILGTMVLPSNSIYGATKAGLKHFTRLAALELAEKGIRVNSISPGPVRTAIFVPVYKSGIKWKYLESLTLMNKIIEPEEIGELVAYLASDRARSVTGADFTIDAGASIKK